MPSSMSDYEKLIVDLRARAKKLGFDAFGVTSAQARPDLETKLNTALQRDWHGDMEWMADTAGRRVAPQALWPEARSIIMVGVNYGPQTDPMADLEQKAQGNISVYARNRDYHDLIKGRLKELAGLLARKASAEVKVFVDTAPVMEKPLAAASGIGWQGKHTILVSREFGSWMFLGAIFTNLELPLSQPHRESCGTCSNCLDVCPTNAFPAPFQLDARRCLAYLNIELSGQIPRQFRAPMGNRIYGCDDCLAVCPWNKFASETKEAKLKSREDLNAPSLSDLLDLDDTKFRKLFSGSPIKRLGIGRFLRNVLISSGNSADDRLLDKVEQRIVDPDPLVRGAAIWAFRRLAKPEKIIQVERQLKTHEKDMSVRAEWDGALTPSLDC